MKQMLRSVLAVVAGLIVAMVVVALLEAAGHLVFPLPDGIDPHNPESIRTIMDQMPPGAIASVLVAWTVATFAGGWLAARIAGTSPIAHSFCVGIIMLLSAVTTMLIIPHPVWFWAATLILLPGAMLAAGRLAGRQKVPELSE